MIAAISNANDNGNDNDTDDARDERNDTLWQNQCASRVNEGAIPLSLCFAG